MRVEHDGAYAVVASMGGAPKHPVWYYNLVANPLVELQDGPAPADYIAREVTGDEKATWWNALLPRIPITPSTRPRPDREIPVFVLEPAN